MNRFLLQDTVKYVENQVQTVGESVKKIYSDVVHDFHPPLGDDKQAKAQAGTVTQNDPTGTNISSMVGIKEKHSPASESESSKDQDTVDLRSCDTSQVDHLEQFSPAPSADSPQVEETHSLWIESSYVATKNNTEVVVEENVVGENYPEASYLNSPKDENSSELALYWREQHLLTENLESSVDGNLSGTSDNSNDGDQRNIILAEYSPRNLVEDVGLRPSRRDKTICNGTDLSNEAETGLFSKQDAETAIYKKSDIGADTNATVEEHPASEHSSSLEGKNSWELLWTQEQHPVGYGFHASEDKSSSIRSSSDEDHKIVNMVKCSPEILAPDTVLRVDLVKQESDSNADPAEEGVSYLSLEHDGCVGFMKCGVALEANVRKECLVVDNRSYPSYESSSDLSLHGKKHPKAEDSNLLQDKSLCESLRISKNEDYWLTTLAKLSPETSVNDERFVLREEGGEFNKPYCSNETENDFSLDGYCSCISSDLGVEDNGFTEKHAAPEYLGCPEHKNSCESCLCSRKLHVVADDFDSPNGESSSGLSLISRTEDRRSIIPANISPVNSVNGAGLRASRKDETTCYNLSNVLGTNLSSGMVSSGIPWEHKVVETKASSSSVSTELLDPLEFSYANSTWKTQEVCCDYTDSGGCTSAHSSISCAGLTSGNKAVNLNPAFPRTASSSGGYFILLMFFRSCENFSSSSHSFLLLFLSLLC